VIKVVAAIIGLSPAIGILYLMALIYFRLSYPDGITIALFWDRVWPKPKPTKWVRKMEHTGYYCHDIGWIDKKANPTRPIPGTGGT